MQRDQDRKFVSDTRGKYPSLETKLDSKHSDARNSLLSSHESR